MDVYQSDVRAALGIVEAVRLAGTSTMQTRQSHMVNLVTVIEPRDLSHPIKPIVAKLGAPARQLVQVLVDRIGVVGRGDRLA